MVLAISVTLAYLRQRSCMYPPDCNAFNGAIQKSVMAKSPKIGGWNRGKTIGRMRPFTLEQVQLIRAALAAKNDLRGLSLFEVGISTMLRSSDLLSLCVNDVMSEGRIIETFDVRQKKTRGVVGVSLSSPAAAALLAYIAAAGLRSEGRLWKFGRLRHSQMVKAWARMAYADPRFYSTHSIRRTYPTHIHKVTGSHEIPRQLLGHSSLMATVSYLGVDKEEALAVKKLHEM